MRIEAAIFAAFCVIVFFREGVAAQQAELPGVWNANLSVASGTGAQAKNRDLVVYASGESSAIARCAGVFADFAKQSADLGVFGNGSRMKFVANHLVAIHNVATAEAMILAERAGLDPKMALTTGWSFFQSQPKTAPARARSPPGDGMGFHPGTR